MAMPVQTVEERLSSALVHAIVARAGASCSVPQPDYGVDLTVTQITRVRNGYDHTGWQFHAQLKATCAFRENADRISYDMKVKDYNKLARWTGAAPCYLLLVCLPEEQDSWLSATEDALVMRRCCYWVQIDSKPSGNASTTCVHIPREQLFTPDTVSQLLAATRNYGPRP